MGLCLIIALVAAYVLCLAWPHRTGEGVREVDDSPAARALRALRR
jgi:hypothetical protein